MFDSEISMDDLEKIVPRIQRSLNRSTEFMALEVWGNLQEFSPQEHGRLAGSWKLEKKGNRSYIVGSNVEYALVQNDGSDPYMIYPRQAKVLRFKIKGEWIFATEVLHPGIQGTHYIEGSIAAADKRKNEFIEMALREEGL